MDDLRSMLDDARLRLARVSREDLGAVQERGRMRRMLGAQTSIVPVGDAWHVGVLLVGDDLLWQTGRVLRASEEVRRGYAAESQRERAEVRAAAFRGGFAEGQVFHLDWRPVDVEAVARGTDDGPLAWRGDELMVRWSPAGFLRPLGEYLDEQISLLLDTDRD